MCAPYVVPNETLKVLAHIRHRKKIGVFKKFDILKIFHLCRLGAHTFSQIYIFVSIIYGSYSLQNIIFLYKVEMQRRRRKNQYKKIWGNFQAFHVEKSKILAMCLFVLEIPGKYFCSITYQFSGIFRESDKLSRNFCYT